MLSSRYNPHLTIIPQTSYHRGASNLSGLDDGSSSYLGVFGGLTVDLMGDGCCLVHPHSVGSLLLKFRPRLQTSVRPPASSHSSVCSPQLHRRLTDIIQDKSQNLPHALLLQNANGLQARMLLFGSSLLNGMFWWERGRRTWWWGVWQWWNCGWDGKTRCGEDENEVWMMKRWTVWRHRSTV